MLHSLYDFKATYAKTLSFRANDYFVLHQTNTKHKNWWEVVNEKGEMGFIPSNYVEKVTVSPSFYIQFLDTCIENLKRHEASPEYIIGDHKELILRLKEIKRKVEHLPEIRKNSIGTNDDVPPLLFRNSEGHLETVKSSKSGSSSSTSFSSHITELKNAGTFEEEPITPVQRRTLSHDSFKKSLENIHNEMLSEQQKKVDNIPSQTKVSPVITHQSVFDLVESVRINTKLSHEMSRIALVTVIQGLHELLPASVFPYLSTILTHAQTSLVVDDVQIDQTHDASRLKIIFNELTSCKEDSQQRSWMLHEDESVIKDYITELISILVSSVCQFIHLLAVF